MYVGHTHATVCMWWSTGNLQESVLFPPCGAWEWNLGCQVLQAPYFYLQKSVYPLTFHRQGDFMLLAL